MSNSPDIIPSEPAELREFTVRLLAELKNRDLLIEKLRHQVAGQNTHRLRSPSKLTRTQKPNPSTDHCLIIRHVSSGSCLSAMLEPIAVARCAKSVVTQQMSWNTFQGALS